jgi:hypothetical protein
MKKNELIWTGAVPLIVTFGEAAGGTQVTIDRDAGRPGVALEKGETARGGGPCNVVEQAGLGLAGIGAPEDARLDDGGHHEMAGGQRLGAAVFEPARDFSFTKPEFDS